MHRVLSEPRSGESKDLPTRAPRAFGLGGAAAVLTLLTTPLAAQRPFPATPPTLPPLKPVALPAMTDRTLPNGLRLIVVEQRELPVLDAALVVRTGVESDPAAKRGLATLTANLLDEGAGSRSSLAIAEQSALLGIQLGTGASWDQSTISLHTTMAVLDSALALFADVALRPTFPDGDFTRLKSERLTSLLQEQDRGPAIADRAFAHIVFGDAHPYGTVPQGSRDGVEAITPADVQQFWSQWYRPNNATLIIVGDITPADAERRALQHFGAWTRAALPVRPLFRIPASATARIYLVDKPKAPQSSFRLGGVGVARSTPDFYSLTVMNTVLGGAFTSRLNNNLRETKGYTYGANSGFAMRREAGPFVARAEIVAEKSDSALIEFMKELREIRKPVPADELLKAKRYLTLGYAERFESTRDIAGEIGGVVTQGLPLETLGRFQQNVAKVTAADVQRVATRYIDPAKLAIVITGDREKIEKGLAATKIAPIEVRGLGGRPTMVP
ncbi:MAG: insulinase family protein [Gemmatimonadaceae bacterium]|nr:insulinase family protein [Gemmatimonadaceae bacterium]